MTVLIKAGKSIIHVLQSSVDFFVNSCLFPFISGRILSLPSSSLTCMFFFFLRGTLQPASSASSTFSGVGTLLPSFKGAKLAKE